jgi:NYN domain
MTLARERAITHAYLVSGDGDLVEGVRVAQDLGVHVTLMYIQAGNQSNSISHDLRREVDRRIELTSTDLAPFVAPATAPISRCVEAAVQPGSEVQEQASGETNLISTDQELVSAVARKYVQEWIGRATDEDVTSLTESHPEIPQQLDAELLEGAEATVGPLRARQSLRHSLRSAFWDELQAVISQPPQPIAEDQD